MIFGTHSVEEPAFIYRIFIALVLSDMAVPIEEIC
jgi:hypothetical protein